MRQKVYCWPYWLTKVFLVGIMDRYGDMVFVKSIAAYQVPRDILFYSSKKTVSGIMVSTEVIT